jgi:hypothetical protein
MTRSGSVNTFFLLPWRWHDSSFVLGWQEVLRGMYLYLRLERCGLVFNGSGVSGGREDLGWTHLMLAVYICAGAGVGSWM